MANLKQLRADIDFTSTLRLIAQAYEEISVMRMRKVRASVLSSREFVSMISGIFYDVKNSYKHVIEELLKKQKKTIEDKKKRTLTILLSANTKLYGSIVSEVFSEFAEQVEKEDTDLLIIGRFGKDLYEEKGYKKPYLYFEIPDSQVTVDDIKPIIFNIIPYETINVFYAQFETILHQTVVISNITGDQPFNVLMEKPQQTDDKISYLFEPTIDEVLTFFQKQVFASLFKQTVHEAHLAHFASRVNAMEQALVHVDSRAKILYIEERKARKMVEQKKNLERIAGIALWK